jgi:hypothetical protein
MLQAAKAESQIADNELCLLLEESDRSLAPLGDPLRVNLGLHRWLRKEREEAYSDWLNWILQQLKTDEILNVLGISDFLAPHLEQPVSIAALMQRCKAKPNCDREVVIQRGRLDIVIRFGNDALIVIEVKKSSAEDANTAKQKDYTTWIHGQRVPYRSVLLVVDASDEDYKGFEPLRWDSFCVALRQMLPNIRERLGIVATAMFVAFISAVERNLLGLVPPEEGQYGRSLRYARTAQHIERSLPARKQGVGMNGPKIQDADALFTKGAMLYPQALAVIDEFIRQVQEKFRKAIESNLDKISGALGIRLNLRSIEEFPGPKKVFEGIAVPEAYVGQQILDEKKGGWTVGFYLYWGEGNLDIVVSTKFKNKKRAEVVHKAFQEARRKCPLEVGGREVSLCRRVTLGETGHIDELLREAIGEWCAAWQQVGGFKKFLAKLPPM